MALSTAAKVGLGLAVLYVLLRPKTSAAKGGGVVLTGQKVAKFSSYEGDTATWAKARYKVAHDYFQKYWASAFTDEAIKDAALSILAQWSLETGSGAGESNFNLGNIHAFGSQAYFQSGDVDDKGNAYQAAFASYKDLDAGAKGYFDLLESDRYKDCLDKLAEKPAEADWFKCLGQKGYFAKTKKDSKTGAIVDNIEPAAAGWAARRALLAQYATA